MPLYDYRCEECSVDFTEVRTIAERKFATCPSCGKPSKLQVPKRAPGVSTFRAGYYEHIARDPIYCSTPQELRDACDRNNCYSHYLENSLFSTSPGPDPERI